MDRLVALYQWLVPWLTSVVCDLCIFSRAGLFSLGTIDIWGQVVSPLLWELCCAL